MNINYICLKCMKEKLAQFDELPDIVKVLANAAWIEISDGCFFR